MRLLRRRQQQRRALRDHEGMLIMRRRSVVRRDDCPFIRRDERSARRLLRISLVYLPALLVLFMLVPLV